MTDTMTKARPASTECAAVANMMMRSPQTGLEFRRLTVLSGGSSRHPVGRAGRLRGGRSSPAPFADTCCWCFAASRRRRASSRTPCSAGSTLVLDTEDGKFHYGKFSRDQTKEGNAATTATTWWPRILGPWSWAGTTTSRTSHSTR